jgi:cell division septation protein DedD
MDSSLKQRLVGAIVLIALAVIFLPMLVKGPAPDSGVSDVSLEIPARPGLTGDSATRDLPLIEPGAPPGRGAVGMPVATRQAASDETAQDGRFPAVAAGDYAVGFGSYGSAGDADKVIAALRSAGLPAYREAVSLNGRQAQRVRVGPFADRAVAESARLRAAQVNGSVGAKVVVLDADATATAAAAPAPAVVGTEAQPAATSKPVAATSAPAAPALDAKPSAATPAKPVAATPPAPTPAAAAKPADTSKTGFAVQVGAFAVAGDASALRDKLRGAGFNAFTEAVNTDKGTLTRVRVGPAMTRAEADQLKASVQARLGIAGIVRPHP